MTLYPLYHPGHEKDLSESWFFPVFVSILPLGPGLILNDLTEPVSQFLGLQLSMKLALYALGLLGLMLATRFAWEESELRSAEVVPR